MLSYSVKLRVALRCLLEKPLSPPTAMGSVKGSWAVVFFACVEKYAFENCKSFSAPAFVTTFFLCKYLDMVKVSSKCCCLIIS